jgi:beta-glucosidase
LKATTTRAAVSVQIANTGEYDGSVVLQVYISAVGSSIKRPVKELHGFDKVTLMTGVTKEVQVAIDDYAGSFWDESESRWVAEAGEYLVLIGMSSTNFVPAGSFHIKKTHTWLGL